MNETIYRPVLVDLNRAMEATGKRREAVLDMVDSGELLWVWDMSADYRGDRRVLRFWLREMTDQISRTLSLAEVVSVIVGHAYAPALRRVTVSEMLMLRRCQVLRFVRLGALRRRPDRHPGWVERDSLIECLKQRWVGSVQ